MKKNFLRHSISLIILSIFLILAIGSDDSNKSHSGSTATSSGSTYNEDDDYKRTLKNANNFLSKEQYDNAKSSFEAALNLKTVPNDKIKDKISICVQKI